MHRLRHPIDTNREPFGKAGLIIAVLALAFAMLGGAYAATSDSGVDRDTSSGKRHKRKSNGALSGKQKKEVKKIAQTEAKKFATAGTQGPAGPAGANGKDGPRGPAGANGSNGTNGISPVGVAFDGNRNGCSDGGVEVKGANTTFVCNGKRGRNGISVASSQFSGTEGPCAEGGSKFEGAGEPTYACNGVPGAPGSPWTAGGTLPAEATETGVWLLEVTSRQPFPNIYAARTTISFPIPLATKLSSTTIQVNAVGYNGGDETGSEHERCPGTVDQPKAKAGYLCVYTQQKNYKSAGLQSLSFVSGLKIDEFAQEKEGEVVVSEPGDTAFGTWAVTAPAVAP